MFSSRPAPASLRGGTLFGVKHIRPPRRVAFALGALLLCPLLLSGCAKPLFSPEDERTPFDRFDSVRNQFAQQEVFDEFGRKRPNLRGRLTPRN